jgi:hypothetical protein
MLKFRVISVKHVTSSQLRTVVLTRENHRTPFNGGEYEELNLQPIREENPHIEVGNILGSVVSNELIITINDSSLFGNYKVGSILTLQ